MGDWLDYRLADFVLFAPETYWRLFQLHNAAFWPWHPVLLGALTALALGVALRWRWRWSGAVTGLGLAIVWVLIAQTFLVARYEPINWAVGYLAPLFWAEAAGLLVLGPGLTSGAAGRPQVPAQILCGAALAYPVVGWLAGRPLVQAEVAGLAPDPTAMMTLGLLALMQPGWRNLVLAIAPLVWLLASALTLYAMGDAMFAAPLLGTVVGVLALWSGRLARPDCP